jgi:hypothetical protein
MEHCLFIDDVRNSDLPGTMVIFYGYVKLQQGNYMPTSYPRMVKTCQSRQNH